MTERTGLSLEDRVAAAMRHMDALRPLRAYAAPNLATPAEQARLYSAFTVGCSLREAARQAGVTKCCALYWQRVFGGKAHFETEHGAKFKQNRWK